MRNGLSEGCGRSPKARFAAQHVGVPGAYGRSFKQQHVASIYGEHIVLDVRSCWEPRTDHYQDGRG